MDSDEAAPSPAGPAANPAADRAADRAANPHANRAANPPGGVPSAFEAALARIDEGADLREEAVALLGHLTLDERLGMLDGDVDFWPGLADLIGGGYTEHTFPGAAVPRLGIPGIEFSDGPRGVVVGPATCFPVSMARGATWNPALEVRIGDAIGRELRAKGANLYGGVCINLLRHPAWGRAQETYGEDPLLLGEMGAALTRGVQRHAMACVKHFALNSMENARFQVDVIVDERSLHECYLPHFRRVVDEGAAVVMSAYNSVNGSWAGESRHLLTDVLRNHWGFEGIVISDWIYGLRDAAASLHGGMDIEMPYRMVRHQHLRHQLDDGTADWDDVDAACEHIITTLLRFAPTWSSSPPRPDVVACQAHTDLAREVARKSFVLLQNDDALLPLDRTRLQRVAVIGALAAQPNLGDLGSSRVQPPWVITPLDGIRAALAEITVDHHDGTDPSAAAAMAAGSDVAIVVVGYTHEDEGEYVGLEGSAHLSSLFPPQPPGTNELLAASFEKGARDQRSFGKGGDRSSLRLSPEHEALITAVAAAQANTVVCLMGGSAVVMESWRHLVPGIMLIWYPGMAGGAALADLLLGEHGPTGRLPCTIPMDESHLPDFDREASTVTYDRWFGYRRLARDGHQAAFPFGFGLAYTTFEVTDAAVETSARSLQVTATVTNTGTAVGDDVLQVYAGLPGSGLEREPLALVGFARTGELDPGAGTTITIDVPHENLSVWQPERDAWWLEPGTYRVVVGRCADDRHATVLSVELPDDEPA